MSFGTLNVGLATTVSYIIEVEVRPAAAAAPPASRAKDRRNGDACSRRRRAGGAAAAAAGQTSTSIIYHTVVSKLTLSVANDKRLLPVKFDVF